MIHERRFGLSLVTASLVLIGLCSAKAADDKSDKQKATLAGSWKLSMAMAGGQRGARPTAGGTARPANAAARPRGTGGRGGAGGGLTRQIMLNLTEKDGKYSGDFVGFSGKPAPIQDVKLKDGEITFKVPQQMGPNTFTMTVVAKLDGDKLQGSAKIATPAGSREFPFQGERIKASTVSTSGTWKLHTAPKDGLTFEPTVKLTQAGNAIKGVYIGEQGETPITNAILFGDEVSFDVARERGDKKYRLHFTGKIKGDTLTGNVDYDFDGMSGYIPVTGERVAAAAPQASAEKAK
jgi:hypothetical protein